MFKKNLLMIISMIIILFILVPCSAYATNQNVLTGEISILTSNKLIFNNKVFPINNDIRITYVDQNGKELIKLTEIPPNSYAKCFLNSKEQIEAIEVSGRVKHEINNQIIKVLDFTQQIDNFKISSDKKFISYFNWESKDLNVLDLHTAQIIWKIKISGTDSSYDWHPEQPILAFSTVTENGYKIYLYNLTTSKLQVLVNCDEQSSVDFLLWNPNGKFLAYTVLQGLPDAHGYITSLNFIDLSGTVSKFTQLNSINFLIWSLTGQYLAYSEFVENDFSGSRIGIFDLENNKVTTLKKTGHNPIFTSDNNLIYCNLDHLTENIIYYNLKSKHEEIIKKELRYITDFDWLDYKSLIYTFGDLPQIKKLNIETRETEVINEGFSPFITSNKTLYFLGKNADCSQISLYIYNP